MLRAKLVTTGVLLDLYSDLSYDFVDGEWVEDRPYAVASWGTDATAAAQGCVDATTRTEAEWRAVVAAAKAWRERA